MNDPARFRDGAPDVPAELTRLFQAGTNDLPSEGDLRRLAARLGPVLEPPPGGSAWPGWPVVGKMAALAAVVSGAAVFFALNFGPHTPRPPDVPDRVPLPPEAPPPAAPGTTPPAPSGEGADSAALPPASSAPAPSPPARTSAPAARPAESEAELLERARDALSANPARALALTEQHRAHFPAGVLAQEREVIAIQALKRLGRTDEAARRTADFSRRYPNSAYRKKLDASSP